MAQPYTKTQISLHWLIFLFIALQYLGHEAIAQAWEKLSRGEAIPFDPLVLGHVFLGGLIFLMVLMRIAARLRHGAPALPEEEPAAMRMLAQLTHLGLYVLMIAMPVSGAVAWFFRNEAAGEAHEVMRVLLLALVLLHVVGALYHQFVLKTNVMARMKRPGGEA
ncbi:cytochrome b [Marimonas arenosa]|uniref:Cytochrome b/b6 domain-containing protein n=1 Tax=Marimonas arenosa TaxID=1795305 RepID=A0AAE3WCJ6_9RHOB|nr:cytochrome b/b6 domain-containing protein [Marimonas arenosa]MDQ2089993.1 cytochrome b/b6 domain-containing protein [Marimonas arenosa]